MDGEARRVGCVSGWLRLSDVGRNLAVGVGILNVVFTGGSMPTTPSDLPESVTKSYWTEIRRLLQVDHKLKAVASARAVRAYVSAIARAGVGDIIYHAPVEDTARGIVAGGYAAAGEAPKARRPPTTAKKKSVAPRTPAMKGRSATSANG